jgi:hypothetical protein
MVELAISIFTITAPRNHMNRLTLSITVGPHGLAAALLCCVLLTGCGSGRGEVSGTVTCDGKPLPFGTIQFLGADGIPYAGTIGPDGTFSVQVPVGQAKVIVSCLDEAQQKQIASQLMAARGRTAPPRPISGKLSLIPLRYAGWETSGLTIPVVSGANQQDFNLTSN